MKISSRSFAVGALVAACFVPVSRAQSDTPNLVHDHHDHAHNPPHETVPATDSRFYTTRRSDMVLPLPSEEGAFVFAVFGDRTGGPDEGVNVLADAVRDVNLLEPDLVMTVGDLIQGYGQDDAWLEEMVEYKAIMDKLLCPWFPVAGNHDVYWRGPDRPEGEHETNYEMHFGPLWYSFQHKNANFIALYTDEGNAETGEKSFRDPENQQMSAEQYDFLQQALIRGKDLDHQFVFVHHPRWLEGGYGTDWNDKVHPLLTEVGNVTAVFAGHIHRMRADPKDGIQYVTLATVGGHQSGTVPDAGFLHHYNLVTVRKDQVAMAAIPVGEVLDVRELTGELHEECLELARLAPEIEGVLSLESNGAASGEFAVEVSNPTSRSVDFMLAPESVDRRWFMSPDHTHGTLAAGASKTLRFRVARDPGAIDDAFDGVRFALHREYLAPGFRYEIPVVTANLPLNIQAIDLAAYSSPRVLVLDGEGQAVKVPSEVASIDSGTFTIEGWINAEGFDGRTAVFSKAENSEYGLFANNGQPHFSVFLNGKYVAASAEKTLQAGRWYHLAGVYDGEAVRLYIDGQEAAAAKAPIDAVFTTNDHDFYIGADPHRWRGIGSFFHGAVDDVRLSAAAVYTGEFTPARNLAVDINTVFLYDFDRLVGPIVPDASSRANHAEAVGVVRAIDGDAN